MPAIAPQRTMDAVARPGDRQRVEATMAVLQREPELFEPGETVAQGVAPAEAGRDA